MRGYWLVLLLFAIRYGLLALVDPGALPRAAHYAPMDETERAPNLIYQACSVLIPGILCFLPVRFDGPQGTVGLVFLAAGTALFVWSVFEFARAPAGVIVRKGVYRFCRHPMYAAYFLFFLGGALMASSWLLLALVGIFQMCAHRLALAEERWCLLTYGRDYDDYMKQTGRYFPKNLRRNRTAKG